MSHTDKSNKGTSRETKDNQKTNKQNGIILLTKKMEFRINQPGDKPDDL
jgi:hypothetical protein